VQAIMDWLDQHNIDAGLCCGTEQAEIDGMASHAEPLLEQAIAESIRDTGSDTNHVEDGVMIYDHDLGKYRRGLFEANKDTVSLRLLACGQNQTLII